MISLSPDAPEHSKAVIETRLTHEVHRAASTLLAEAATEPSVPPGALALLRDFLVVNLRHHHQVEDDDLWPRIIAAAPGVADALKVLSGEHERLEANLDVLAGLVIGDSAAGDAAAGPGASGSGEAGRARLRQAAIAVRDTLHEHLAHEEPILLPALREHISPAAWDEFAQRVIATTPPVAGHLMIGFLDEVGTPAEVESVLAGLPEPARPLIPAMRAQAAQDLKVLRGSGS